MKISEHGKPTPKNFLIQPVIKDPRNFMNRETLEIKWDEVHKYYQQWAEYWKQVPYEERNGPLQEQKYYELLYEVEDKCPGESRHETALRYIRERQARYNENQGQISAKKID